MFDRGKDVKELTFLYDWMRLARKPHFNLQQDIKMLFELIAIPITDSEMKIIQREIDPEGKKTQLTKQDLLACFAVEEEHRKPMEKQLLKAFKYISRDQDDITFDDLRAHFIAEEVDPITTDLIVKQLGQYENEKGNFDFKTFAATIY